MFWLPLVFFRNYLRQNNPLRRQQLKWLTRGTLLTVIPFTVLDVIPFLTGIPVPSVLAKLGGHLPDFFAADL